MVIFLHSSKTMRHPSATAATAYSTPLYQAEADELAERLQSFDVSVLQTAMALSPKKAAEVADLIASYNTGARLPAIDAFLGDIYSGLQVHTLTPRDRTYAHDHLIILSGLYGALRALDGIVPYRLEMGYKFPGLNMYAFWGDKIARIIPSGQPIINLSAKEYTKAVLPYFKDIEGLQDAMVVSPKFLTVSPKTGEPTFVTVHAKIARGAFARWLIQQRIEDVDRLKDFAEIGYSYDASRSTPNEPVFVAQDFQGLGLSVRLT